MITLIAAIFGSGGISALGGYLLSGRNERKKDDRLADREWRTARERQGDEARTFQRDTLLELHDLLYKFNRNTGTRQHIDEMHYRATGKYGREKYPEELSNEFTVLLTSINKLRVRIFDPELRAKVKEYTDSVIAIANVGARRKEGDDAAVSAKVAERERKSSAHYGPLEEKLGVAIRSQFPGSDIAPLVQRPARERPEIPRLFVPARRS